MGWRCFRDIPIWIFFFFFLRISEFNSFDFPKRLIQLLALRFKRHGIGSPGVSGRDEGHLCPFAVLESVRMRTVRFHIFWLLFPFNFFFKLELDMEIPHGGQQQGRRVAFKKSPHGSSDPHIHTHIHTTMAESSTRYTTSQKQTNSIFHF